MTVPAHGDTAPAGPTHHPLPGTAPVAEAPPLPDYTAGSHREVSADEYEETAEKARARAYEVARAQAAARPEHPDDTRGPDAEEAIADMRAEVRQETAVPTVTRSPAPEGSIEVTLSTRNGVDTVRVLEVDDWPSSANSALHVGDMESWAEVCLADGDYEQVWLRLDPNLREVREMFDEWKRISGRDRGKSSTSPRSLRRGARR